MRAFCSASLCLITNLRMINSPKLRQMPSLKKKKEMSNLRMIQ